jgi:hypothetical protein
MNNPLDAMFWNTVRHWCLAKPTIVVQGDAEINQSSLRGTVEAFIVGKSIVFRRESGELTTLPLSQCRVRLAEPSRLTPECDLDELETVITFHLACNSEDTWGLLEITELRNLGEPN